MTDPTYLRLDVTAWTLISSYHDASAVIGAWGPFPTEDAATQAQAALLEAGVDLQRCTVLPIRPVVTQP